MGDPDSDNALRPFAAKLLKIPMGTQQMQGYLHPQMNNEPLKFNTKKGKPPMPIEGGGDKRQSTGKKKTVVCKHWLNGTCKMGDECTFLHEYDMERMPDLSKKRKDSLHDNEELPMPPLPPMDNNMANMANTGNMGMMGAGPGFFGGPMGFGPMMGPGATPEMMNQMMMFGQMGGQMGGPGMPMGGWSGTPMGGDTGMMLPQKEIITLKCCVLYPPPPNAPPPTTRERPPGCRTIFVGGLPEVVTEDNLEEVFVNYGAITSVRKSKKKNFAHVRFEEEAAVERSLFLSGYRMKIDDKDDKPNTGRLHVDYAMARDDQFEYECKMRAQMRDLRHRQRLEEERLRPPSPPPVTHYSDFESAALTEKLRSDEEFVKASHVLQTWLERGEVNRKNINQFYSMIQCTNAHIRRLLSEKQTHEEELQKMKEKFKNIFEGILRQFDQIERIFTTAQKQRNWDHFTKAQRKNIELWLKQCREIKQSQQEEFFSGRQEDEMEMSDDDEAGPSAKKKNKTEFSEELTNSYAEMAGKLGQINTLKDENDALKCQVEAYKNELSMMKTDNQNKTHGTKQEVKSLQLALQGMQQQLITSRNEVEELKKKLEQERIDRKVEKQLSQERQEREKGEKSDAEKDSVERKESVDLEEATISSTGLQVTDKEAKLIGLVCCFLHVHPTGASLDYIWSYLHRLGFVCRVSEVENLMERMNMIFRQEVSGVGATIERRWHYTGYKELPLGAVL